MRHFVSREALDPVEFVFLLGVASVADDAAGPGVEHPHTNIILFSSRLKMVSTGDVCR